MEKTDASSAYRRLKSTNIKTRAPLNSQRSQAKRLNEARRMRNSRRKQKSSTERVAKRHRTADKKQVSLTERTMKSAERPTDDSIVGRTPRTVPRIPESSRICPGERTQKITKT